MKYRFLFFDQSIRDIIRTSLRTGPHRKKRSSQLELNFIERHFVLSPEGFISSLPAPGLLMKPSGERTKCLSTKFKSSCTQDLTLTMISMTWMTEDLHRRLAQYAESILWYLPIQSSRAGFQPGFVSHQAKNAFSKGGWSPGETLSTCRTETRLESAPQDPDFPTTAPNQETEARSLLFEACGYCY